ncbi:MAG TPA: hypothetical protein VMG35_09905, partial [Bryobacteraceae bacterium]|nr:hypothetical protein [Bryobacteraceae bacterium]
MDLLDKFCGLQAGRGDISLKPAPQSDGSLVELPRYIPAYTALDPLHLRFELPSLDGQAFDQFVRAFFQGDLGQLDNDESWVVLIEPDFVTRSYLANEPFRIERSHSQSHANDIFSSWSNSSRRTTWSRDFWT